MTAPARPSPSGSSAPSWSSRPSGSLFARKAVHAALCMAFVMVNLGVLYIMEQAQFLGIVQIFVYTGAVMMLFLFVLMLVGVDSADSVVETIRGQRLWRSCSRLGLAGWSSSSPWAASRSPSPSSSTRSTTTTPAT